MLVLASEFDASERADAERVLLAAVDGVGDDRMERLFRMCVTTCLHRGLSDDEVERLPADWRRRPGSALAGGPLEVFRSRGVPPGLLSCEPCHAPRKELLRGIPRAYLPLDCGECPPCRQRAQIEREGASAVYEACGARCWP